MYTLPGACTEYTVHGTDVCCDGNNKGRDASADGNLQACIDSQILSGFRFLVWLNYRECWGSETCNKPYPCQNTINYDLKNCLTRGKIGKSFKKHVPIDDVWVIINKFCPNWTK